MHNLYVYKFELDPTIPVVSYDMNRNYFNENFHISFGYSKTDTCPTCDQLQIQLDTADDTLKGSIREQVEDHQRKAESFYSNMRTDTSLAK